MNKFILCLLAPAICFGAAITSNGTGGGLAAVGSSWAGGVAPGNGDTVSFANGDTITIPAATTSTWGASPGDDTSTAAIGCTSTTGTGRLVVNGNLVVRGSTRQCNANWTFGPLAHVSHDSSLASGAGPSATHYTWHIGLVAGTTIAFAVLSINGPTPIAGVCPATITIDIAPGSGYAGGFTGFTSSAQDTGIIQGQCATVDHWGEGAFWSRFSLHTGTNAYSVDHFKITNSGNIAWNEMAATAIINITNNSFTSQVLAATAYSLEMTGTPSAATSGYRNITGNYMYGGGVKFNATTSATKSSIDLNIRFKRNTLYKSATSGALIVSGNQPGFSGDNWSDNLIYYNVSSGISFPTQASLPGGQLTRTIALSDWYTTCTNQVNWHMTSTPPSVDSEITQWIFEPQCGGPNGGPDGIQVFISASPITHAWNVFLRYNLFLPGRDDGKGWAAVNHNGATPCDNSTNDCPFIYVERNTWSGNKAIGTPTTDGGTIKIESNNGVAGLFASIQNNVYSQATLGASNFFAANTGDLGFAAGMITTADYNWIYNNSGTNYVNNTGGDGYTNTPGTHDTTGTDPAFADSSRNFLTWCQSKDGTITTWLGCISRFDPFGANYNANFRIADAIDWIRLGWRVTATAAKTAASDGSFVGAIPPQAPTGVPSALSGLSTSGADLQPYTLPAPPAASGSYQDTYHPNGSGYVNLTRLVATPSNCPVAVWKNDVVYPPWWGVSSGGNYYYIPFSAGTKSTLAAPPQTGGVVNSPWVQVTQAQVCAARSIVPAYSQRPAWNSDNSMMYAITSYGGGDFWVYSGNGSTLLYSITNASVVSNQEDETWSRTDPAIMWYQDNSNGSPVGLKTRKQLNVTTGAVTTIKTFDVTGTECPSNTGYIRNGGSGNPSLDDRYWAMYCQDATTNNQTRFIVYDQQTNAVVSQSDVLTLCSGAQADVDWMGMSTSGKYVVVQWDRPVIKKADTWETCYGSELFAWQSGAFVSRGMITSKNGHSDVGLDAYGRDIHVMPFGFEFTGNPVTGNKIGFTIAATVLDDVFPPPTGIGYPLDFFMVPTKVYYVPCSWYSQQVANSEPYSGCFPATSFGGRSWHVSGRGTETTTPGWMLMSSFTDNTNPAQEFAGWGRSENVFLYLDTMLPTLSNLPFRRVSRNLGSRSHSITAQCSDGQDYWQEPHATVNRDSTSIFFGSVWLSQCNQIYGIITNLTGPLPPPPAGLLGGNAVLGAARH